MNNKTAYHRLADLWTTRQRELQKTLLEKHKESFDWLSKNSKNLAVGSIGSLLLFTMPLTSSSSAQQIAAEQFNKDIDKSVFLISDLRNVLPHEVESLSSDQEKSVAEVLSRYFGLSVSAEFDGKRLNRSYGLIGQEQHLARYPGDSVDLHNLPSYGMAPGLGAYGYFAPSQEKMTQKDIAREQYYIAVQTFLAPDFQKRVAEYNNFFRFRKMLVVNPQNGKAIVTDIGDAGPGESTGKHLGGSPEVMQYLQRYDGAQKGPVLYFFINDPKDSVPLGPIGIQ